VTGPSWLNAPNPVRGKGLVEIPLSQVWGRDRFIASTTAQPGPIDDHFTRRILPHHFTRPKSGDNGDPGGGPAACRGVAKRAMSLPPTPNRKRVSTHQEVGRGKNLRPRFIEHRQRSVSQP
jgi:hypothetical protein